MPTIFSILTTSCSKTKEAYKKIEPIINTDDNIHVECSEILTNESFTITFSILDDQYIISAESYILIGTNKIKITDLISSYDKNSIMVPKEQVNSNNIQINFFTIKKELKICDGSINLEGISGIADCDKKYWHTLFGDWEVHAELSLDNDTHTTIPNGIKVGQLGFPMFGIRISWLENLHIGIYSFFIKASYKNNEHWYETNSNNITLEIKQDVTNLPLNVTAEEDGTLTLVTTHSASYTPRLYDLKYSINGNVWIDFPKDGLYLSKNQTVYLKGNNLQGWSYHEKIGLQLEDPDEEVYRTFDFTGKFRISGNPMSLVYDDDCSKKITRNEYCFAYLFKESNLISVDSDLLKRIVPFAEGIFKGMFEGCTFLTNAPSLPFLPEENLSYNYFGEQCYAYMFADCTSLEIAPDLMSVNPGNNDRKYCYDHMFYGCTKLRYIKIGTIWRFDSNFWQWVGGNFSPNGDFYYNGQAITRGENAIPNGWIVHKFD